MHREYAGLQGAAGVHVELDSTKAHAADATNAVLLLRPERNRRGRTVYLHRGSLGGIYIQKNNRGIFEKLGATKAKNIILANDNDEKRTLFENCRLKAKRVVNPIIDWADKDVYGFLEDAKCPMNPLYADGQCRVGCIGCPMAGRKGRETEFTRWPKYKQLYLNAFERMLEERKRRSKGSAWTTAEDVFRWWMEYDVLPGQISTEDYLEMIEE